MALRAHGGAPRPLPDSDAAGGSAGLRSALGHRLPRVMYDCSPTG